MEDLQLNGLHVVLGSSSKWRKAVFESYFPGLPFTTNAADIDERAVTAGYAARGTANPEALTLALAHAKATAILAKNIGNTSLLITSDQVLSFKGTIREKPRDEDECRRFLRSYADHPAVTVTAVLVTNTKTGFHAEGVDIAKQNFHPISEHVISELIAKGDVLHSAGGFTVEDPLLAPYLGAREGTEDSIMGLPIALLSALLNTAAGGS